MKVYGINGGPGRYRNAAVVPEHAPAGAVSR